MQPRPALATRVLSVLAAVRPSVPVVGPVSACSRRPRPVFDVRLRVPQKVPVRSWREDRKTPPDRFRATTDVRSSASPDARRDAPPVVVEEPRSPLHPRHVVGVFEHLIRVSTPLYSFSGCDTRPRRRRTRQRSSSGVGTCPGDLSVAPAALPPVPMPDSLISPVPPNGRSSTNAVLYPVSVRSSFRPVRRDKPLETFSSECRTPGPLEFVAHGPGVFG